MQCKKGFTVIEALSYIIIVQILIVLISNFLIYIPHKSNEMFTKQIDTTNAALFLTSFSAIIENNNEIDFVRITNGVKLFLINKEIIIINNKNLVINGLEKSILVNNYDINSNLLVLSLCFGNYSKDLIIKGRFNEIY